MEAVVLQSFGDVLLDYATLLEGPQIDDELVGALAVRACVDFVKKPPREHETAARCSHDHEDGFMKTRDREDAIFTKFNFGQC